MTTMTTTAPAADRYLSAVQHELGDLPADERSALLEDLALHLDALAEEDDDRPLEVRLGGPSDYAAELRAAAGLPPRAASRAAGPLTGAHDAAQRLLASRAVREVRVFVPQLQPAWWVLRGYLAVAVPSLLGVDSSRDFPVPSPWGSAALGVLLVALAVVASVAVGRRRLPLFGRLSVLVLEAVLVLLSLQLLGAATDRLRVPVAAGGAVVSADQPLLSPAGPVTDVLPYAADGTPLEGVLLFDQDGRPLRVGAQQWWADGCRRVLEHPRAADGVPVPFSYPQAYVLERSPDPGDPCRTDLARPDVPLPTFPAAPAVP